MEDQIIITKEAINNEKKGYDLYQEASVNSSNEIIRGLFRYLASQELVHIKKIEEFDKTAAEQINYFFEGLESNIIHFDEAKQLFSKSIAEWKEEFRNEDDIGVLKKALQFEKEGYEFYKNHYMNTGDENLKKFFKFLCKEEDLHYHFIQNMLEYMENPAQFNLDDEDWFFEG